MNELDFTVTGLTPAIIGAGLDFDVTLTAVPVANPVTIAPVDGSGVSATIDVDVDAITEDETGYDNLMVVGLEQGTAKGSSRVWPVAAGTSTMRTPEVSGD